MPPPHAPPCTPTPCPRTPPSPPIIPSHLVASEGDLLAGPAAPPCGGEEPLHLEMRHDAGVAHAVEPGENVLEGDDDGLARVEAPRDVRAGIGTRAAPSPPGGLGGGCGCLAPGKFETPRHADSGHL